MNIHMNKLEQSTKVTLGRNIKIRWVFVTLLLIGAIVNYLDRANLSIANPVIAKAFHLSPLEMGFLLSAFLWPYAIANLPAGYLVDRYGPKKMFAWASGLWSVVSILTSFASGYSFFYAMRILLGIAESPFFTSGIKVTDRWFTKKERAFPTSIINTGSQIANAIAPPLLTILMLTLSWRGMFFVIGLAGLVVMLVWLFVYRDPDEYETQAIMSNADEESVSPVVEEKGNWLALFKHSTTWSMMIGNFGIVYTVWVYLTWLPGYLVKERHMSLLHTGWIASIPFIAGIIGVPIGGIISDYFIRKGGNPITARKIPIVGGATLAAAAVAPVPFIHSTPLVITLLAIGYFASQLPQGVVWTLAADMAPRGQVASLGSIQNFAGFLGASLAPIVTGAIIQATGSFHNVFLVGAGLLLVGAVSYGVFLRKPVQAI
jgi:MFS family permease